MWLPFAATFPGEEGCDPSTYQVTDMSTLLLLQMAMPSKIAPVSSTNVPVLNMLLYTMPCSHAPSHPLFFHTQDVPLFIGWAIEQKQKDHQAQ